MEAISISQAKDMIIELIKQALSEKIEETCSKICLSLYRLRFSISESEKMYSDSFIIAPHARRILNFKRNYQK